MKRTRSRFSASAIREMNRPRQRRRGPAGRGGDRAAPAVSPPLRYSPGAGEMTFQRFQLCAALLAASWRSSSFL